MNIAFTGHRDRILDKSQLSAIAHKYPDATWIHGGAVGFDTQVCNFAREHGINQVVVRPDYRTIHPKRAPLVRNEQIVDMADLVVACYDGRQHGGTLYTMRYASRRNKPLLILQPTQANAQLGTLPSARAA